MSSSILAHVALKLTGRREQVATEALAFLLQNSPSARRALERILHPAGQLNLCSAVSEHVAGEESRPDIALLGPDGKPVAYVEGKFWAGLTDSQPTEYLRRLAEVGGSHLLFVVPERRIVPLRHELMLRVATEAVPSRTNWLRIGALELGVVSWAGLLDAIESEAAAAGETGVVADARQLRGLCEAMEDAAFAPVSRSEIEDGDVPRLVIQLSSLIQDAVNLAESRAILSFEGLRPAHGYFSAGRYAKFRNAGCWIGLQHVHWRERGRTPFWAVFSTSGYGRALEISKGLAAWLTTTPPRAYVIPDGNYFIVPLAVPADIEREPALNALVDEIAALRLAVEALPIPDAPKGNAPNETP